MMMIWIFWCAALLIVYTYLGYAGWLWLRASMRPWPVRRAPVEPAVSVIMVVRNEERWLKNKLDNLLELDYPATHLEIVIVSDGSTDATEAILRRYADDSRIRVVLNQLSRGKASGLNDGIAAASGEVIVFTDVRQKIEPGAIRLLMENLADPEVGCVSGALMLGDPAMGEAAKGMGLYWMIEKAVREVESASGSVVGATGALYAVRRELLNSVPEGTILDDVYIPMQVVRKNRRVVFEPRAQAWDCADLGAGREFSRKVRTLTGNYQLVQLAPWLLTRENPIRFQFVSHKLLRLAVPFALAALLLSSLFLSGAVYRAAFVLQVLFYSLGLLAALRLSRGPLTRMSDAALTFVVLNTAAALAFANFVTGRKSVWAVEHPRAAAVREVH
jgi:cellulose synthase/poly-beta-1,6-N-acetylglucosamine synthase-like glycosyltransferase